MWIRDHVPKIYASLNYYRKLFLMQIAIFFVAQLCNYIKLHAFKTVQDSHQNDLMQRNFV